MPKAVVALCPLLLAANLIAQVPSHATTTPAGQTAPATPATAAAAAAPPAVVAGIPVNYDEAKVGTYSLTDPLKLDNGKTVRDAKTWTGERRPELLRIFETPAVRHRPGSSAGRIF